MNDTIYNICIILIAGIGRGQNGKVADSVQQNAAGLGPFKNERMKAVRVDTARHSSAQNNLAPHSSAQFKNKYTKIARCISISNLIHMCHIEF